MFLGTAFAQGFADFGAKLAVNDLKRHRAVEAIQKIVGKDIHALPVEADMSKDDEVAHMVTQVIEHYGTIDILVNAAAVQIYPWERDHATGTKGMGFCVKHRPQGSLP